MNSYLRAAWPFGLSGAGLCLFGFLTMYALDVEPLSMNLILGYVFVPVFVFFGIKSFRDGFNGGNLYFSQGMSVGFFVYSLMALLSALYVYVFLHLDPPTFEAFRQVNLKLMEDNRQILEEQLNETAYTETLASLSAMSILDVATNDFLRKIFPGLFFTIIISIILKRTVNT
ncbi:DUF4199 domain-containing protein [Cyclobacterium plantarum]|uniref:DUF4199 domain-containing protein n=1 Tax=Cyclobacterium plantarum TaxID=2716263 RepID=A0ABX0HBS1_9BACT|nr:DUF4199 domain-containing protein [Cyclobacterium plantarum]NHE59355.1 DUF4199 domain-containing protein [Cyclobacterium plantarum]